MRKSKCIRFFEKYLHEVSRGFGFRELQNPAIKFIWDTKTGKYNEISDKDYELLLQEIKEISEFWRNKPKKKAADVLQTALEDINIDKYSLHKIAEILSECYSSSVSAFIPEDSEQEKTEQEKTVQEKTVQEEPEQEDSIQEPDDSEEDLDLDSPQEIYNFLSKRIYGQKEAVRAASMLLYNHRQGRKRNVLFIGQTGSGKTEIWRACKTLCPNVHIIDSTIITQEGWSGSFKVNNIFDDMDPQEAEKAIIVFDEFDKLCEPKIGSGGTNYSYGVQNELLKLIEGTTIHTKRFDVDTSEISFVFCGSFQRLTEMKADSEAQRSLGFGAKLEKKEAYLVYKDMLQSSDLVKYAGMRQEIAGRINQIVQLSPMTAGAYKEILNDEQMSPLHQLERQYGVKLCLDQDTEQKLVQEAEETRMGVRYLRSRIQQMLDEQMFWNCGQTEYRLGA